HRVHRDFLETIQRIPSRKCVNSMDLAMTRVQVSMSIKFLISYTYLASATFPFKNQIKIVPEKLVEGKNGRGNLDYGIESRTTSITVGLNEVNKDDFKYR